MPPRILPRFQITYPTNAPPYICSQCRHYASLFPTASATPPAPIQLHPPTQPPSHKPPHFRKSQLLRQYQSLLRSTPLTIIFQHNNLKATEWMAVRRELSKAMARVDEELTKAGDAEAIGASIKISVVQTGIFAAALRVVQFWDPKFESESKQSRNNAPAASAVSLAQDREQVVNHGLSRRAHTHATYAHTTLKLTHGLEPLLSGPLALLTFPSLSPKHLAAALRILSPSAPAFPAPKRRENPAYHEPAVQNGVQKLMMLGAKVGGEEGKVLDFEGVRWVGGLVMGVQGLRAELVSLLSQPSVGLSRALEGVSLGLMGAVEGRRGMLEAEEKDGSGIS